MKSINDAANGLINGFGTVVLLFAILGLISVPALNLYGGSLTLISAIDSLRRSVPRWRCDWLRSPLRRCCRWWLR